MIRAYVVRCRYITHDIWPGSFCQAIFRPECFYVVSNFTALCQQWVECDHTRADYKNMIEKWDVSRSNLYCFIGETPLCFVRWRRHAKHVECVAMTYLISCDISTLYGSMRSHTYYYFYDKLYLIVDENCCSGENRNARSILHSNILSIFIWFGYAIEMRLNTKTYKEKNVDIDVVSDEYESTRNFIRQNVIQNS